MSFSLSLILLFLFALAAAFVLPRIKSGLPSPSRRRHWFTTPWRAVGVLATANLLLLALVAILLVGLYALEAPVGPVVPAGVGVLLSIVVWARVGAALPFNGRRRWLVALGGMGPHILLTLLAVAWYSSIPDVGPQGEDTFMQALGSVVLGMAGVGATIVGTLIVGGSKGPFLPGGGKEQPPHA